MKKCGQKWLCVCDGVRMNGVINIAQSDMTVEEDRRICMNSKWW